MGIGKKKGTLLYRSVPRHVLSGRSLELEPSRKLDLTFAILCAACTSDASEAGGEVQGRRIARPSVHSRVNTENVRPVCDVESFR